LAHAGENIDWPQRRERRPPVNIGREVREEPLLVPEHELLPDDDGPVGNPGYEPLPAEVPDAVPVEPPAP
jgi:hypothetical protein